MTEIIKYINILVGKFLKKKSSSAQMTTDEC